MKSTVHAIVHNSFIKSVYFQLTPLPQRPLVLDGCQHYHVSVYTSFSSSGRFTGAASLRLYGTDGQSGPIELQDGQRKVSVML